jgi:predicted SnoaL-like aldol condensation-catalyzing enzyme
MMRPTARFILLALATSLLSVAGAGPPTPGPGANLASNAALTRSNRAIVEKFVDLFYRQKNVREAFERYVVEDYIQHNPAIADGRAAAIKALEPMFSRAQAQFDIKRILVDGNLAAVHLHGRPSSSDAGGAVVDLFRLENGKIVEHWDVLQAMPATAANAHPMF